MTITVRLDDDLERRLSRAARAKGFTRSAMVRHCVEEYLRRQARRQTPWELGKDLFGRERSGRSDLSRTAKRIARDKVHARKGRC